MTHVVKRRFEPYTTDTWNYLITDGGKGLSATYICPNDHWATLEDHDIKADGTVEPSVICPNCDFHKWIRLEGWNPQHLNNPQ